MISNGDRGLQAEDWTCSNDLIWSCSCCLEDVTIIVLLCLVMFWPDLVFILQFLWRSAVEITYLISYHWNTATLFRTTYGRWIFYLFCFWIIVFYRSSADDLECLKVLGGISWSISIYSDWHHARLGSPDWARLCPNLVNPSDRTAGSQAHALTVTDSVHSLLIFQY